MAAIYSLCAVTVRLPIRAAVTRVIHVSGFDFSIVGDDGGLGTLFMHAVWGDPSAGPERRFPQLVAHRPERVRSLHRELADTWKTARARFVTVAGDDYGDWFIGEFESVLELYRDASDRGQWITSDPERLERTLIPMPLAPLPMPSTIGLAGAVALGAFGLHTWRARRIAAIRALRRR